jgi:hypothetical protein
MNKSGAKLWADSMDAALDAWLGREGRLRIDAVIPGAGLNDLVEKLSASPKDEWPRVCAEHGRERASDICLYYRDKPGDLWHRGGVYWWTTYGVEFHDALKAVTKSPRVHRLRIYGPAMAAAEEAFKDTAERLRDRLTGYTAEERKALGEAGTDAGLLRSETLGELAERMGVKRQSRGL